MNHPRHVYCHYTLPVYFSLTRYLKYHHRLRWRQQDKERLLVTSNALTIAGLALLAVAITCTVFVLTDFLFHRSWAALFTALVAAAFLLLWYGLPLAAALRDLRESRRSR